MHETLESLKTETGKQMAARIGIGVGLVVVGAYGSLQRRVHITGWPRAEGPWVCGWG